MDNLAYFNKALLRPYPAYTNGDLLEYRYNRENKTFSMTWKEDKNNGSPTMVFIPSIAKDAVKSIDKSFNAKIEPISNSSAGWLVITPLENGEKRRIEVKFKE
jgi:endoglycosylceramidase